MCVCVHLFVHGMLCLQGVRELSSCAGGECVCSGLHFEDLDHLITSHLNLKMTLKEDFLHDSLDDDAPRLDGQNPEGLKSAAVPACGRLSLCFKAQHALNTVPGVFDGDLVLICPRSSSLWV